MSSTTTPAATLSGTRTARAGLAYLFEPGSPELRELLAVHGPLAGYERMRGGALPRTMLRPELRHLSGDDLWARAARAVEAGERHDRIAIPEDPDWPPRLADPAILCLWVRGNQPLAMTLRQSVAVVGAPSPTAYGTKVAADLGYALAERGWTVVSGGSTAVDAVVLRAARAGAGSTVAVLPCGMDTHGREVDGDLLAHSGARDVAVSPWPPDAPPTGYRIAATYRLLAALSAGVVVVEATEHSGVLQALREAARLGRPAMVVPGPAMSARSAGCHQALRHDPRIRLVTGVDDVLEEVGCADPPHDREA